MTLKNVLNDLTRYELAEAGQNLLVRFLDMTRDDSYSVSFQ